MKNFSILAAGSLALLAATPAYAAVTIDPDGAGAMSSVSLSNGGSTTIYFDGFGGAPAVVAGLTSNLVLTLTGSSYDGGTNRTTFNFGYQVNNTSSTPILTSRVSGFGFNTNPNIYFEDPKGKGNPNQFTFPGTSATGVFDSLTVNANMPNFGTVELCFSDQGCPGGGGNGVDKGQSGSGTLALAFAGNLSSVSMSDFVVRYQSITGAGQVTSAVGRPYTPPAVPEPTTWAMMLIGFGLVGGFMRSSKGANVRTRIAFN